MATPFIKINCFEFCIILPRIASDSFKVYLKDTRIPRLLRRVFISMTFPGFELGGSKSVPGEHTFMQTL